MADINDLGPIRMTAKLDVLMDRAAEEIRSAVEGPPGEALWTMLRALARVRPALDDTTDNLVRYMRETSVEWSEIAELLGCDEQTARTTYGFVEGQHTRSVIYVDEVPSN